MVVGNGLIANRFKAFRSNDAYVILASGVSNSKNKDPEAYLREKDLISNHLLQFKEKIFIYFSTCSVYDPSEKESLYVKHKLEMEKMIIDSGCKYIILRVSNLVGKSNNKNTIFGFYVQQIQAGEHFNLWKNATRNLIDIDDFYEISLAILSNANFDNQIINVANPSSENVVNIVKQIEAYYKIQGLYTIIEKGQDFKINTDKIVDVILATGIRFDNHYITKLLDKYYST